MDTPGVKLGTVTSQLRLQLFDAGGALQKGVALQVYARATDFPEDEKEAEQTESHDGVFCQAHTRRWRRSGIGDPAEFIAISQRAGRRRIDYRQLPPQLTLEFQYAVQCRSGERTHPAPPWIIQPAIRLARQAGVTSLLNHGEQQWRDIAAASGLVNSSGQAPGSDPITEK